MERSSRCSPSTTGTTDFATDLSHFDCYVNPKEWVERVKKELVTIEAVVACGLSLKPATIRKLVAHLNFLSWAREAAENVCVEKRGLDALFSRMRLFHAGFCAGHASGQIVFGPSLLDSLKTQALAGLTANMQTAAKAYNKAAAIVSILSLDSATTQSELSEQRTTDSGASSSFVPTVTSTPVQAPVIFTRRTAPGQEPDAPHSTVATVSEVTQLPTTSSGAPCTNTDEDEDVMMCKVKSIATVTATGKTPGRASDSANANSPFENELDYMPIVDCCDPVSAAEITPQVPTRQSFDKHDSEDELCMSMMEVIDPVNDPEDELCMSMMEVIDPVIPTGIRNEDDEEGDEDQDKEDEDGEEVEDEDDEEVEGQNYENEDEEDEDEEEEDEEEEDEEEEEEEDEEEEEEDDDDDEEENDEKEESVEAICKDVLKKIMKTAIGGDYDSEEVDSDMDDQGNLRDFVIPDDALSPRKKRKRLLVANSDSD